jgi:hypothetical protein
MDEANVDTFSYEESSNRWIQALEALSMLAIANHDQRS